MSENLTFNQISTLASDLRAVSDATYPVKGIISDEYNSTAHYVVGDYCIRNNVLYRCNTDTPNNGEVWNADHWDESSVGEALSKIDWKLLWENASPTSEFAAQTISLNLIAYDFILIVGDLNVAATSHQYFNSICLKDLKNVIGSGSGSGQYTYNRTAEISNSGIVFATGGRDGSTSDGYTVPLYIYGIKSPISS